jgi:hypothetical protein
MRSLSDQNHAHNHNKQNKSTVKHLPILAGVKPAAPVPLDLEMPLRILRILRTLYKHNVKVVFHSHPWK